ncbi:MAG: L,D-transpeptidase family protein [Robiginitomaculum sp.]|nr:L,D-transpeptidase family protein [Robiginitomaculum sp.]
MNIVVETSKSTLSIGSKVYACAIGKKGTIPFEQGREGDGKTPLGMYPLRYGLYRNDRISLPACPLEFHIIGENDGWCDAAIDPAYNRPVHLPYPASAEKLYKDSHVYDIIIVLGHNDNPPIADLGSAIFLHIARPNYAPTEGCIAISQTDMLSLLPKLTRDTCIDIQ